MGATGDSKMYTPYLKSIGAVMTESDAIYGAMCWCPITALDTADGAYEWNMGATRNRLSDEEQKISDALGKTVEYRENMYNPMYFISDYYDGYGSSTIAPNWRIRSGIEQGDTALTVEINLALALSTLGKNVDFATVWGEGHTEAEASGTSSDNFISWVNELCK